jgi:ribonuclease HI
MSLISKFNHIQIEWILREQNKEADRLSNYAYTRVIANNPKLREKISQHTLQNNNESLMIID